MTAQPDAATTTRDRMARVLCDRRRQQLQLAGPGVIVTHTSEGDAMPCPACQSDATALLPLLVGELRVAELRGEHRALRESTDLYCKPDKDLIRGWATTTGETLRKETEALEGARQSSV